ncbi:PfkB family carbohydrate kinase [Candidatus Poseidonia alphae]|uniref:PfkB family carbohydrate kinase n=1 Tax=Candidatus Poseidonia alphae TaxID=1915863 RepID=UPI00231BCDF3|nr:PfkB family carbohydrate kinase [Candidatus Poseidonia alphae]MDA8759555.1 PfkB family carbohydrate kinase [Candidatus Poseidonia alphae]MDB2335782.1 PfkB family carbohydrate kinase [Candidatus Poseidonia alphae]MDB2569473.1 PfkB family carbohydrate kinase [Candidatus Poseidonia alphae]MDC0625904.1 PfkB family carbohydrate kinase [Candidatus Poseidonia alphae]
MSVLIVGSLAYDSVESPEGSVREALGGSATYAGLACQFHLDRMQRSSAALVGVVGEDFDEQDRTVLSDAGLNLTGIQVAPGKTFRWEGSYHGSMAEAVTKATYLNVFEHFKPEIAPPLSSPSIVFCANLHPGIQASVMDQTSPQRLTMLDSMNLWIEIAQPDLLKVMRRADVVIINDGEVRMLAGDDNIVRAMNTLAKETSTSTLVVKRGEHGVIALHNGQWIALPAYPTADIADPTGCGDSFAGSLAAHFSLSEGPVTLHELKQGLAVATVTASFTLTSFGTEALCKLTTEQFEQRLADYASMIEFS